MGSAWDTAIADTWFRVRMLLAAVVAQRADRDDLLDRDQHLARGACHREVQGARPDDLHIAALVGALSVDDECIDPQSGDDADLSAVDGIAHVVASDMRASMSDPPGSWNGIDGRFCCAARKAWIMASAVQSRTGRAFVSAAARKRGGRPKISRLEKQMSIDAIAPASRSRSREAGRQPRTHSASPRRRVRPMARSRAIGSRAKWWPPTPNVSPGLTIAASPSTSTKRGRFGLTSEIFGWLGRAVIAVLPRCGSVS